jgi:hypothetical protein
VFALRHQGGAAAKATKTATAAKSGLRSKKPSIVRKNTTFNRPKTLKLARAPKYDRKSAPKVNKMDQFQIIKFVFPSRNLNPPPPHPLSPFPLFSLPLSFTFTIPRAKGAQEAKKDGWGDSGRRAENTYASRPFCRQT